MGGIFSEKLSTLLDTEKGAKLADRIHELLLSLNNKSALNEVSKNKRSVADEPESKKKLKEENGVEPAGIVANPMSATDVSEV